MKKRVNPSVIQTERSVLGFVESDFVPDYPCLVCGVTFKSRHLLATHPHPKKEAKRSE